MISTPTISVDAGLKDLLSAFIARKHKDLNRIITQSRVPDFDAIANTAHRLTGEGGSFGFDAITEAGRKIERAARAHQGKVVASLAAELFVYLDAVQIVYSAMDE
jgi:HPt (histidine-containing phosphotransfer) domain-containing protein